MKNIILYTLMVILIFAMPRSHADTTANSDFNPFPQMEQDMNSVGDQAASSTDVQNDDWPPSHSVTNVNGEASHE